MPTAPDWGVPVHTVTGPGGRVAYLAQYPGAPRFQIWVGGRMTCDKYAFSSSDRVSLNGAWGSDGVLLLMAGPSKNWLGLPVYGGPRLQRYDDQGRLLSDDFAGPPDQRASFVPVPVDVVRTVERVVEVHPPVLAAGTGFPVRVAFEGRRPEAYARAVFAELARLLVPAGVGLSTERPDRPPSAYGQLLLDVPLRFAGGYPSWPGPRWDAPVGAAFEARAVYVPPLDDPLVVGAAGAHEVGHAFGLVHRPGAAGDVMNPTTQPAPAWHPDDLAALRARTAAAAARG